jgi:hypothetical protein
MPVKVARWMLRAPDSSPPWRYVETAGEKELRESMEETGSWCG